MREKWKTVLVVGIPVLVTVLALVGRLVIETEAERYEAALRDCLDRKDMASERCRVLTCLARAENDEARAECVKSPPADASAPSRD